MPRPVSEGVADWGVPDVRPRSSGWPGLLGSGGLAAGVAVLVAVVLSAAVAAIVGPGVAVVAFVLVLAASAWWVDGQPRRVLRAMKARPVGDGEPRVGNIARGLASDLGVEPPHLYVIEDADGGPNALVCGTRRTHVAVTRSMLSTYTRTELEAVLAHCLGRLVSGSAQRATMAIATGPLARVLARPSPTEDDLRAVALTRYPPALISAIEKASPRDGRRAQLWFVADGRDASANHKDADPPASETLVAERVAVLSDL